MITKSFSLSKTSHECRHFFFKYRKCPHVSSQTSIHFSNVFTFQNVTFQKKMSSFSNKISSLKSVNADNCEKHRCPHLQNVLTCPHFKKLNVTTSKNALTLIKCPYLSKKKKTNPDFHKCLH